jgi:hypothetical protein
MIRSSARRATVAALAASSLFIAGPGLAAPAASASAGLEGSIVAAATAAADGWRHPADVLPERSLGVLVLRDGAGQVGGLRTAWSDGLAAGPLGDLIAAIPNIGAVRIGWFGLSADAGTDPWSAAAALLGDQLAVGLLPPADGAAGDEPLPVLIAFAAGERGAIVDRVLGSVRRLAGIERAGRIDPDRQDDVAGGTITRVSDELSAGRRGPYLVLAPADRTVREVLRQLDAADPAGATTVIPATVPASVAAADSAPDAAGGAGVAGMDAIPDDAAVWARVSPAVLQQLTGALPSRLPNPLGSVVAGGWVKSLASAERTLGWLSWTGNEVRLGVDLPSSAGLPATHAAFRTPAIATPVIDLRGVAGYLGEIALPRDMASIVQQRESLMTTGAAGQLIEFVNGISAIMGNFDMLEEVFSRLGGPMRLVAVNRPAAGAGAGADAETRRPVPELPMFALVMPVASPSPDLAARIRSGALTAMGIINIERGNQQQPGLIVDTDRIGEVRTVFGRFPAAADGEIPDISANFAPTIAVVRDRIIIASDPALLRSFVEAGAGSDRTDLPGDAMHVSGAALADILGRNRETLIAGRMIDEGESRAEAESFTDRLMAGLAAVRDIGARVTVDDEAARGEMVVRFRVAGERE